MKDRIRTIFNALQNVETKGQSTLIVADCLRELANILNELPDEKETDND